MDIHGSPTSEKKKNNTWHKPILTCQELQAVVDLEKIQLIGLATWKMSFL